MTRFFTSHLHPITRKRIARFAEMKRAYWSFWILVVLYGVSLASELVANEKPLLMRFEGRWFAPVLFTYSQNEILADGVNTRPNFKALKMSERFKASPQNLMVFPPVPFGPRETLPPSAVKLPDLITASFIAEPLVASVDIRPDGSVARTAGEKELLRGLDDGVKLETVVSVSDAFRSAVERRFRNESAETIALPVKLADGRDVVLSLAAFASRSQPPKTVRLSLRSEVPARRNAAQIEFDRSGNVVKDRGAIWSSVEDAEKSRIAAAAVSRFDGVVEPLAAQLSSGRHRVSFIREDVRFPFRPVEGHPLGIDSAGRDVLARIIYGFRTSLTFALLLVGVSTALGAFIGATQGYFGGRIDLFGQRITEIWETLPVLYIIMLLGSVFGRSFTLLLVCYALFNWIGLSYYIRAEFLKLRKLPFVEAAQCLGLSHHKIMWRHIFPNALVPIITFFPFSLVAAVGTLAALDFLGFGIPPPTASWGELLSQAQEYNWAWWLTLYPSLALFSVMLLGTFIGEGVRAAFDPRRFSRLE